MTFVAVGHNVAPMAKRHKRPFDLCLEYLQSDPSASYPWILRRVMPKRWSNRMSFPPIVYGRCKALLGIIPMRRRRKSSRHKPKSKAS